MLDPASDLVAAKTLFWARAAVYVPAAIATIQLIWVARRQWKNRLGIDAKALLKLAATNPQRGILQMRPLEDAPLIPLVLSHKSRHFFSVQGPWERLLAKGLIMPANPETQGINVALSTGITSMNVYRYALTPLGWDIASTLPEKVIQRLEERCLIPSDSLEVVGANGIRRKA